MRFKFFLIAVFFINFIFSCADYNIIKKQNDQNKIYYSSKGFALIYEEKLFKNKIINKKINTEEIKVMHNKLKANTPILITNPDNSKFIKTKIHKKADYPKIFNIIITNKISNILELDLNNPYVEVIELKQNKTFVAKEGKIFDEEKIVANKAPVDEIEMNDLSKDQKELKVRKRKKDNFVLVISDFYYEETANELKNDLIKKINLNNIFVKKINNNKYRLLVGPFKNFNTLKSSYISLNNLGFEELMVYKE